MNDKEIEKLLHLNKMKVEDLNALLAASYNIQEGYGKGKSFVLEENGIIIKIPVEKIIDILEKKMNK